MTNYRQDTEFMAYVGHLLASKQLHRLDTITHHYHTTRLQHSINVAYTSYKIAKRLGWNTEATARGGLLHDLFFYDWRDTKFTKSHAWTHPRIAVRNARKLTKLSPLEEDIILKHMFGATLAPPRYKEAWIVTCVDKYWAVREATIPLQEKWKKRRRWRSKLS